MFEFFDTYFIKTFLPENSLQNMLKIVHRCTKITAIYQLEKMRLKISSLRFCTMVLSNCDCACSRLRFAEKSKFRLTSASKLLVSSSLFFRVMLTEMIRRLLAARWSLIPDVVTSVLEIKPVIS